jgi:hypothetical protein
MDAPSRAFHVVSHVLVSGLRFSSVEWLRPGSISGFDAGLSALLLDKKYLHDADQLVSAGKPIYLRSFPCF